MSTTILRLNAAFRQNKLLFTVQLTISTRVWTHRLPPTTVYKNRLKQSAGAETLTVSSTYASGSKPSVLTPKMLGNRHTITSAPGRGHGSSGICSCRSGSGGFRSSCSSSGSCPSSSSLPPRVLLAAPWPRETARVADPNAPLLLLLPLRIPPLWTRKTNVFRFSKWLCPANCTLS